MLELLWLLLPVAAFSGWLVGRRRGTDEESEEAQPLPDAYFQGLHYLLNDERDKAFDLFTRLVDVDNDTVETHLALGSLFRRRGEVDRAIRIHQNLIARPSLTRRQRTYALLALGEDYMRAGLFDRAEKLFLEVVEGQAHAVQALRHLLTIYEQEKEWRQAVDVARQIERRTGEGYGQRIAHFTCELATRAIGRGDYTQARSLLRQALGHDPGCVRANIMAGDLERQLGRHRQALKAYQQIQRQDQVFLPEVLDGMEACYKALGRDDQFHAFLREAVRQFPAGPVVIRLADTLAAEGDRERAISELAELLRRHPSLDGIQRFVELTHETGQAIGPEALESLLELFEQLEPRRVRYRCQQCGFAGRTLFWQCPGCKGWSTMRPVDTVT